MPEGDSVAGDAVRLRSVLDGEEIETVAGTAPSVRSRSHRILGARVSGVRSLGKNLLIDLSTGYTIRVHRGMTGRWVVGPADRRAHGAARLDLTTIGHRVACYSAPTVEVGRTPEIDRLLDSLGPDVLGDFDIEEFVRRARAVEERTVAGMLLDQKVLAGVGNVYKSELLFLGRIHPRVSVGQISDEQLRDLAAEAKRLLTANVGRQRSTTGSTRRGQATWVYGQAGHGCRECGTKISVTHLDGRVTYWCSRCQPAPDIGPG